MGQPALLCVRALTLPCVRSRYVWLVLCPARACAVCVASCPRCATRGSKAAKIIMGKSSVAIYQLCLELWPVSATTSCIIRSNCGKRLSREGVDAAGTVLGDVGE